MARRSCRAADGYCDFEALFERRATHTARLVAFDVMQIEGEDLRARPLAERRRRLDQLLDPERGAVMLSKPIAGDGPTVFRHAEKLGLEGIVSKRADYPSGPTKNWLKIKSAHYRRSDEARAVFRRANLALTHI
ncbi:MAG: ATP-dependent DNA ligase [Rhodoplanes sp.]